MHEIEFMRSCYCLIQWQIFSHYFTSFLCYILFYLKQFIFFSSGNNESQQRKTIFYKVSYHPPFPPPTSVLSHILSGEVSSANCDIRLIIESVTVLSIKLNHTKNILIKNVVHFVVRFYEVKQRCELHVRMALQQLSQRHI